jgi:adenosylcobinamide-GDP ribazoletransferase
VTAPGPVRRAIRATRLALAFLTIVPIRIHDTDIGAADLAGARWAFPLVGGLIGLALAGLSAGFSRWGAAPAPAAFLLVAAGAVLSGGLHLDGLADSCDGLFLAGDARRRLDVMRDPHVGSFGVAAIVLVLLGKLAALSCWTDARRAWAVLATAVVSRALILVSAGSARYARLEGTGRFLVEAATVRDAVGAAALILAAGAGLAGRGGLVAGASALALTWAWTRLATRRIGGVTGDILGAVVELGEMVFLLILALA